LRPLKIAHVSDTHIRLFDRHIEYRQSFKDLYTQIKAFDPDFIVHTGDIAHSKTTISPEFVDLCTDFLRGLSDIQKTIILLGNHDLNLRNPDKTDAITPIIRAINSENLVVLNDSKPYALTDDVKLYPFSLLDDQRWPKTPESDDEISIALFHGCVNGVVTDSGMTLTSGDLAVEDFEAFDYALLGDIHLADQCIDETGRRAYPGSTIQQNFGEHAEKGYLEWTIRGKKDFDRVFKPVYNPRQYHTIMLEDPQLPKEANIPPNSRVRLKSTKSFDRETVKGLIREAREAYSTDFVQDNVKKAIYLETKEDSETDLREDSSSHLGLVKEFTQTLEVEDEIKEKAYKLVEEELEKVESSEGVSKFTISSLDFSGFFNYGDDNSINFKDLEGICGIFGKNYSGKTSLTETITHNLFGKLSKGAVTNLDIVNYQKNKASSEVILDVDGRTLSVKKTFEKTGKGAKKSAKGNVVAQFLDGECEVIDGETSREVSNAVSDLLGGFENYGMSTLASQFDPLPFISKKSGDRKKILYDIMGLEVCEELYSKFKEERDHYKRLLSEKDIDFDNETASIKGTIQKLESKMELLDKELGKIKGSQSKITEKIIEAKSELKALEQSSGGRIDIDLVERNIQKYERHLETVKADGIDLRRRLEETKSLLEPNYNFKAVKQKIREMEVYRDSQRKLQDDHQRTHSDLKHLMRMLEVNEKKTLNISKVPCNGELDCFYLKDAFEARGLLEENNEKKNELQKELEDLEVGKITKEELRELEDKIKNLGEDLDAQAKLQNKIDKMNNAIEEKRLQFDKFRGLLNEAKKDKENWERNQNSYELMEELDGKLTDLNMELSGFKAEQEDIEFDKNQSLKRIGGLQRDLEGLFDSEEEHKEISEKFEVYSMLSDVYSPKGFPAWVLKSRLPLVNEFINDFVDDVAGFKVELEFKKSKLNIYITDSVSKRPIELASGAEKAITSLALKVGLRKLSKLPKSDFLVLDEPGVWLDAENTQRYSDFLKRVSEEFRFILLITHMEGLKGCCDKIIEIGLKDNFAQVNF